MFYFCSQLEILNQDFCHFKDPVAIKEKIRAFVTAGAQGVQVSLLI